MDSFLIKGPTKLNGEVDISGSKNAALPIMTACLAKPGIYRLKNVPNLRDTRTMIRLLKIIGSKVSVNNSNITIDTTNCDNPEAPYELVKTMRASFYVLGPLLSRFEYSKVSLPGGCAWGPRPIDYHLKAFESLGAQVTLRSGYIVTKGKLKGNVIKFPKPSVGATGNIIMACSNLVENVTVINAAKEPEIVDLCHFLEMTGVKFKGIGTDHLTIKGCNKTLSSTIDYSIIPDRIEAGTFLIACAATGGSITLNNVNHHHLIDTINKLKLSNVTINKINNKLELISNDNKRPVNLKTDVYPGFPTDLQAQWVAYMSTVSGDSKVEDTIYLDRFTHIPELNRLGADIKMNNNTALINGVNKLYGANIMSTDIRASASLIIASMCAVGESHLSRIYHIDRGYENIELKLNKLGANIKRLSS